MAKSYPLVTAWFDSFANTSQRTKDVGSGANRIGKALIGYDVSPGSGGGIPTGFTVGSDTLSLVGSVITTGGGLRWGFYQGALTVTGSQTCTASASGSISSGGLHTNFQVSQGDAALTFGNATTVAEASGGSAGNSTVTVNSTTSDTVYKMMAELAGVATPTTQAPATSITNDAGLNTYFNQQSAGLAGTTGIQTNWNNAFQVLEVGFTLTEAGGGSTLPPKLMAQLLRRR